VTLDGNGSETIDGATTRVMWANEAAILYCDGSTWTKVAGKSIPMMCSMSNSANQQITSANTHTTISLNTANIDNTGLMANTGANKMTTKRAGYYEVVGMAFFMASTLGARFSGSTGIFQVTALVGGVSYAGTMCGINDGYAQPTCTYLLSLSSGVDAQLRGYVSTANLWVSGGTGDALIMLEVPTW